MSSLKNILIIEDNEDTRLFYSKILKREGYQVSEAMDGKRALQCLRGESGPLPDLVVLDLGIPGCEYDEFIRDLSEITQCPTHPIPILVSSGWPDGAKSASLLGAEAFLCKPVDITQFVQTVKNLVH